MNWKRPNLAIKLASAFFALSLFAVALVSYAVYDSSSVILRGLLIDRLTATAELKTVEVENWIQASLENAASFAKLQVLSENMKKWRLVRKTPSSTIWCATFSPDGRFLATGGANHLVHVWDLSEGCQLLNLPHQNTVRQVRFLDDSSHLLTIDYENILRVWEIGHARPVFSERLVNLYSLSAPGEKQLLAVSTWNKKTLVWSVAQLTTAGQDKEPLLSIQGSDSWVALSPNSEMLAVADGRHHTALYRLEPAGESLSARLVATHEGGAGGLAFSPDNKWFASVEKDGLVSIQPLLPDAVLPDYKMMSHLRIHAGEERELAFSTNSAWLGVRNDSSANFNLLRKVTPKDGPPVWRQALDLEEVYGFAFSPGSKPLLVTALDDFATAVWDLSRIDAGGVPFRHDFATEAEGGAGVIFSPDAKLLSVTSWTGRLQFFDVTDVLTSAEPANLASAEMWHTPLPLVTLSGVLRAQVDSRPQWRAAALYDAQGNMVVEALKPEEKESAPFMVDSRSQGAQLRAKILSGDKRPSLLLASTVHNEDGTCFGMLSCRLSHFELDRIMSEHTGVGEHGELYLATQGRLLADSKGRNQCDGGLAPSLSVHDPNTPYVNFAGKNVFGVARHIAPVGWQLVTEMPVNEVLAPARRLAGTALLISSMMVVALLVAGYVLSRRIALPIMAAADIAQKIISGHVDPEAKALEGDEAKVLSAAFLRMQPALEERMRMLQALDIADEVQGRLLPAAPPDVPGLDIAGRCDYCEATGGDYFDYLPTVWQQGQGLAVVVGDVTGHGVPAALLMTSLRAFLRQGLADSSNDPESAKLPAAVIAEVNKQLARDIGPNGHFATLFYLDIHRPSATMRWVRAGHDPAMVYTPESDVFIQLKGSGMALGVIEDADFEQRSRDIYPGQVIVVGTDGIWEASGPKGEMFGKKRLESIVRNTANRPAQEILQAVIDGVNAHVHGELKGQGFFDDLTLVVVKITEIPPPTSGSGNVETA